MLKGRGELRGEYVKLYSELIINTLEIMRELFPNVDCVRQKL